jgi:hypothetical protein
MDDAGAGHRIDAVGDFLETVFSSRGTTADCAAFESPAMRQRVSVLGMAVLVVSALTLLAAEPVRYREFQLGSDLESITKQTGAVTTDAKVIHQRPAVMKNLEWRPRYFPRRLWPQTDPVDVIVFKFYEDQLFKIVVDYGRDRTAGMSESDLISAVTAEYGQSSKPLPQKSTGARPDDYGAPDTLLATWGDTDYSVRLFRTSYPASFRLVVALTRLDDLAQKAGAEAVRLDAQEAPQREIDRQKKETDDDLAAHEKAKTENKAGFRP